MSLSLGEHGFQSRQYQDFSAASDTVEIRRPEEGKNLELTVNGHRYQVSRLANAFPVSSAADAVVFYDHDGEEIGCMKHARELDGESHTLLDDELEKAYFMPRIHAILQMEESLGIENWRVVTNKGEREFQVRDPRNSVHQVGQGRVLIKDVDGNRYEIGNWMGLDRKSTALLMRHL